MLILILGVIITGVSGLEKCMNPMSPPSIRGGPMTQVLTHGHATHGTNPFYSSDCQTLYYVDREENKLHRKCLVSGKADKKLIDAPETEGEGLAFLFPKKDSDEAVVGAGKYIFTAKYNKDDGSVEYSPPIPVAEDGYYISKAHADESGVLFITVNSEADREHRGGKLLKIINRMPQEVKSFENEVIGDFTWTSDCKHFYLVGDYGRCIYKFDYDKNTKDISNKQEVFKMPDGPDPTKNLIAGMDIDTDGCLWVSLLDCGHVMKINTNTGKVESLIGLPVKDLTGITFGGPSNNALMVTTWQKCRTSGRLSGETFYISGVNATGVEDHPVAW